jgi:predicted transcriptional regulator
MTSEEVPLPDAAQTAEPGGPADPGEVSPGESGGGPREDRGRLNLTDPKAIRALAHPVRWALLEALGQAGTLTATQASEMLGESPANCAFHLRTLAKYGFVEEAGGGRGRERPWRQRYDSMSWRTNQDDPQASQAAEALDQVWLERSLARARRSLTSMALWPKGLDETLGGATSRLYLTPQEADELFTELTKTFERLSNPNRYKERRDPKHRPANALPVEFIVLGYPVLDLPPLPAAGDIGADDETNDDTAADGPAAPD